MNTLAFVDGRRAALDGLIDYAGLFPPASLAVPEAVAEYRQAGDGRHAALLGGFICPASRLNDLAGALTQVMAPGDRPFDVNVILDGAPSTAVGLAQSFDAHMGAAASIVACEVAPPDPARPNPAALERLAIAALAVAQDHRVYLEVPVAGQPAGQVEATVAAIADLNRRSGRLAAKVRTGGLDADAFPSTDELAGFIDACGRRDVAFKATAGLHHPRRHHDTDLGVERHGFLNLLLAASLSLEGAERATLEAALSDADPSSITLTAAGLRWDDTPISVATLRSVRSRRFPSFGSCSFDEPVADLIALEMLEGS